MRLTKFIETLRGFDIINEAEKIVNEQPEIIEDLVKQQLLDGKNVDGSFMASMSTDPFFKKPGAWERYAAHKQRTTPRSTVRPFNVPNLYFNGKYHSGLRVYAAGGKVYYPNEASNAELIARKFSPQKTLGLSQESISIYKAKIMIPKLRGRLKGKLR